MANELRPCCDDIPIRNETTCVILVRGGLPTVFATSLTDKREILTLYNQACKDKRTRDWVQLLCVWPGQWSSDAFELTSEKLLDVIWTQGQYQSLQRAKNKQTV